MQKKQQAQWSVVFFVLVGLVNLVVLVVLVISSSASSAILVTPLYRGDLVPPKVGTGLVTPLYRETLFLLKSEQVL